METVKRTKQVEYEIYKTSDGREFDSKSDAQNHEDKLKGKKTPECLGCGRCAEYCPVFLSPVEIRRVLAIGDAKELESLGVMKCIACGLCSFVCPSRLELTDAVTTAKNLVRRLKK